MTKDTVPFTNKYRGHCNACGHTFKAASPTEMQERFGRHARNCPQKQALQALKPVEVTP